MTEPDRLEMGRWQVANKGTFDAAFMGDWCGMHNENPYDVPKDAMIARSTSVTSLLSSVAVVFGCACLGGALGLGIGAALGAIVPGYYRSVFRSGNDAHFDPVAVGVGQGLTQGVVFGGITGLVLVALWYWHPSRGMWRDRKGPVRGG